MPPLPETGVGHTPDPDLVTFAQDQVSLLAWKGPDNPVTRLLPDRFTRVYWDRVRNQPVKAPMRYRTPEAKEYNRRHYAAPIYTIALIVIILISALKIARAWHRSRPHRPLQGGEVLLDMPPLTSAIVSCVLGLAIGIGTWAWATHRQFPQHHMTPASSRELQTALHNYWIDMRYITGTTIPHTIHVLGYTAFVLVPLLFITDFFTLPEWVHTYLSWPFLALLITCVDLPLIDTFYGGSIAKRLDRELAE